MKKRAPRKRTVNVTLRAAEIVRGAEKIYRLETARVPLREVCRIVQVKERSLRKAFVAVYGAPPDRFHRALRLAKARNHFLKTKRQITVAEVARKYGFSELGRFSVQYREMYGENPSATLRRREKLRGRGHSASPH